MSRDRQVGVNLLWLVPGVVGGSEEYACRLLAGMAERDMAGLRLRLFVLEPFLPAHPELRDAFPVEVLPAQGAHKGARVAAENSWLAWRARHHRLDLVHHAGGVVPLLRTVPAVLTIHDLQPLVHPEYFSEVKRLYLHTMLPLSARSARLVCTPSDHARRSVIDLLGVPRNRVMVVPSGLPPHLDDLDPSPAELAAVRARLGIVDPYFLYPAITYPHKNHLFLVQAFAQLLRTHPRVQLVLAGGSAGTEDALHDQVEQLGLGDRVRRVGRVERTDLDALMLGARALTFPSEFEGFGLPVLEAMACGCPVIAADTTALPGVMAGAGLLVDPTDTDGWVAAMASMLDDDGLADRLRALGLERARLFSWEQAAAAQENAYRLALSGLAPRRVAADPDPDLPTPSQPGDNADG